jgi:hypothetical protein
MPAAVILGSTTPLALARAKLAAPAIAASVFAGALFAIDVVLAGEGRSGSERRLGWRVRIAAFQLLRPLAFRYGHLRGLRDQSVCPAPSEHRGERLEQDREIEQH